MIALIREGVTLPLLTMAPHLQMVRVGLQAYGIT